MRPGWRLTVLGLLFASLFGILTLRLWFVQVTQASAAQEQVERQQFDLVPTPAARGEILDRNGVLLAGTEASMAVLVDASLITEDDEEAVIAGLAGLLELPSVEVRARVNESRRLGAPVTVKSELDDDDTLFLVEHAEAFPGVRVQAIPVRVYPEGSTAAHVIGYIGRPSDAELELPGVTPTDEVGKFGVEKVYDVWLRGTPGLTKYRVNSAQEILSVIGEQPSEPGGTVRTTIDLGHQQVLEEALAEGMLLAIREGEAPLRAAGVVLDAQTGAVVAMASVPDFDPNIFIDGLSQSEWGSLLEVGAFNNFVTQGLYPPASTFKVVAYSLAMQKGIYPQSDPQAAPLTDHDQGYFCSGQLEFQFQDGSPNVYNDWRREGHGVVDLHGALEASCDLYFWEVALRVWRGRNSEFAEDEIQEWARLLGFGAHTQIDLPFEARGLVPDREWFERAQQESPGLVRSDGAWSGGDVMNLTIGQGALTSTPLQVANAYAALVNGGTLWQPFVVSEVLDREGDVVLQNAPRPLRRLELDPETVEWLRRDLNSVTSGGTGTARGAFAGFPFADRIGGKTGTAEVVKGRAAADDVDTAWFVGVTEINDPEYVVAVVIDRGGSGGAIAAPTARKVMEALMGVEATPVQAGEVQD